MLDLDLTLGEIYAYGAVGGYEDGFGAVEFRNALKQMNGRPITIHVNSPGGDVGDGISIVNQIRSYQSPVTVVVDSEAASIASVIAASADETRIHDGSRIFIHNPWTVAMGDAREFRGVAELLDVVAVEIAKIYEAKSGTQAETFLELMNKNTTFTAAEALEIGLVDGIIYPKKKKAIAAKTVHEPIASLAAFPERTKADLRLKRSRVSS